MKKLITFLLAIMCMVSFFGCGDGEEVKELSEDEKQLAKVMQFIEEGEYKQAKSSADVSNFDDESYHYIALSEYYVSQKEYGEAVYQLTKGTEDKDVEDDSKKVSRLEEKRDELVDKYGEELKAIRQSERESFIKIKEKLDYIQDEIDKGLDLYYEGKFSKAKILRLKKELNYKIPSYPKSDGYTDEFWAIRDYYHNVKDEIKYLEKFAKDGDSNYIGGSVGAGKVSIGVAKEKSNLASEVKLLDYQEKAHEHKEEFEKLIKSQPKLY